MKNKSIGVSERKDRFLWKTIPPLSSLLVPSFRSYRATHTHLYAHTRICTHTTHTHIKVVAANAILILARGGFKASTIMR